MAEWPKHEGCGKRSPIIHLNPNAIEEFFWQVVPFLRVPVVLVLASSDVPFPSRLTAKVVHVEGGRSLPPFPKEAIDHPMISHIFTTNLNIGLDGSLRHPKLSPIPLGTYRMPHGAQNRQLSTGVVQGYSYCEMAKGQKRSGEKQVWVCGS